MLIAHICLEHRPYFTVYRKEYGWEIIDYNGDCYHQPDLPVKESLSRILCLSSPVSGHITTFFSLQNRSISSNLFLDMTWSEVEDTWRSVIVDLEGVWDPPSVTVTPSSLLSDIDLVRLLVEMNQTEPMRLRSGREIYR